MSDFDVTDNYQLEWADDLSASLTMADGTTVTVELSPMPDWKVASHLVVADRTGLITDDYLHIWANDDAARNAVEHQVRQVINRLVPLGSPINWQNDELIYLLEDQRRIVFCPLCMGANDDGCEACGGTSYIRSEDVATWIDLIDDAGPDERG